MTSSDIWTRLQLAVDALERIAAGDQNARAVARSALQQCKALGRYCETCAEWDTTAVPIMAARPCRACVRDGVPPLRHFAASCPDWVRAGVPHIGEKDE